MTPFEYIIPLVSVLVGLAIADLAVSFNRLLRARQRVRWDGLPLLAAFTAILAVLDIWWMFYQAQGSSFYHTLAGFLPLAAQLILLFLINAAALPDDVPEEGLDLKRFYARNSAYFWGLFAVYFFSIFVTRSVAALEVEWDLLYMIRKSYLSLLVLGFFSSLIYFGNRWYHGLVIIAFLLVYMLAWSGISLEASAQGG